MTQQPDSWYQWYDTCTKAVRAAQRQCLQWGEPYWHVFFVPHNGKYLVGKRHNYSGAIDIAAVGITGKITRFI